MENKDIIKELFSEKLGAYEAPVKPELWANISSQIGANAAAATGSGLSVAAKTIIGVAAAGVLGVATYFAVSSEPESNKQPKAVVNEQTVNPVEETSVEEMHQPEQTQENTQKTGTVAESPENTPDNQHQQPASGNETSGGEVVSSKPAYTPKERTGAPIWQQPKDTGINKAAATSGIPTKEAGNKPAKTQELNQGGTNAGSGKVVKPEAEITQLVNIFSPNGDGSNDYFDVPHKGRLLDFQLVLMDMKNEVVYRTTDPDFSWDGRGENGTMVPTGVYYYIITARDEAGNPVNGYNTLTITH